MGKSLLIRSLMIALVSFMAVGAVVMPQAIHADLNNTTAKVSATLVDKNGRLTICKFDKNAYHVVKEIKGRLSAYTNTVDQTDDSPDVTASGFRLSSLKEGEGVVANNFLPFGTKIRIPSLFGDKIFTVQDRGNPAYFPTINRTDVYFKGGADGRAKAMLFGMQNATIQIVES